MKKRKQLALYTLLMDFGTRRAAAFGLRGFERYLKRWKRAGYTRIVFFMFDVEPWSPAKIYKKYAKFTPFEWNSSIKRWTLNEWNEKYWTKLERMIKIASGMDILLIPNIFPCRYVCEVFKRSIENVGNPYPHNPIWSPKLREYEFALIDRLMMLLHEYYKKPWVSLSNEAQHRNHDEGYDLAMVHKHWLERTGLPLTQVMLDPSHSEFVIAELVEPHMVFGKLCGDIKYARQTNHHVICEHGVGLKKHVDKIVAIYDASEWKRRTHSVFSSDGNVEGSGDEYVLGHWVNPNYQELKAKGKAVWGYSENYICEELPMEIWVRTPDDNHNAYADYKRMKLGRLKALN